MISVVRDHADKIIELTVPMFFDAHVHFRQGKELNEYVNMTARCCDRAVIMPNTTPPLTNGDLVRAYRGEILAASRYPDFNPLMTLYLTPETTATQIVAAKVLLREALVGVKIYPSGATTHSTAGIPIGWLYPRRREAPASFQEVLKAIAGEGLVLNIHGEDPERYLPDREPLFVHGDFIDEYLEKYPTARAVLEHISSATACHHIRELATRYRVGGTITLHHLHLTLDDVVGQNHNYCRPVALSPEDRNQLIGSAAHAQPWCMLGSDSAPHLKEKKLCAEACAGCYTSPVLPEMLADFFAGRTGADNMAKFTSLTARLFYDVPPSGREVTLVRDQSRVPGLTPAGVVPWRAGGDLFFNLRRVYG